jgi:hypothetical protein
MKYTSQKRCGYATDTELESSMLNERERANETHRRNFLRLAATSGAATGLLSLAGSALAAERHKHAAAKVTTSQSSRSERISETAALLRDLWLEHIFWVRNVSLAAFDKNDEAGKTAELQAVANAQAIATTIEPFYGVAAKETFFKLLAGHYGAVKTYLVATLESSAPAQSNATQWLTSNANEIAAFLSKANPHLPKATLGSLLLAHGGHHIQQIQQLKDRNYDAEAQTWKEMKDHVYQIADATTDALAKQFASKF